MGDNKEEPVANEIPPEVGQNMEESQTEAGEPHSETPDILSETGTNFDRSLLEDQETRDRKEEEKFFYKFDDWFEASPNQPSPSETTDAGSQR